jgi:beta-ribofuranosylaminobenzene 5'-phosphate synthase
MSIAAALSAIVDGAAPEAPDLARMVSRGGTSGIGVYAFGRGGFIVDGGHRWPDEKRDLGPSRAFEDVPVPPLIARLEFPSWGVLLAIPRGCQGSSGSAEVDLFRSMLPIPEQEVAASCRAALLGLLPAVATADYDGFCMAVEEYRQVGMKKRQINLAGSAFCRIMKAVSDVGARGVSVSCWGPSVFGFFPTFGAALAAKRALDTTEWLHTIATQTRNVGATIHTSDASDS